MRIRSGTYIAAAARLGLALLAVLAGCGGSARERAPSGPLTVYTSLPGHGVDARAAEAAEAGARLALSDAGGRAGGRRVRLLPLDDSDPTGNSSWDPDAVEANAARAAADPTAIAYIGELDEGGSAVSVPVTNEAGLLQVSPADGLTTLTREQPGVAAGTGPDRYYPSGRRTFIRLVPADALQAAALVRWARERGARRLAIVQDDEVFGRVLAQQAATVAEHDGLTVTAVAEPHDDPSSFPGFARKVAERTPDAVLYTGVGGAAAGRLLAAVHRALPDAHLYGSSALASAQPVPPGLPAVDVLSPFLPPSEYGPRAQRLLRRVTPRPEPAVAAAALYGYESMRVVLDGIGAAGSAAAERPAVVRAAMRAGARSSAIGHYAVLPSGDVSTTRFGAYRLSAGRLRFATVRLANR